MAAEWRFHPAMGQVENDERNDEDDDDGDTGEKDDRQEAGPVGRPLLDVVGNLLQLARDVVQMLLQILLEVVGMLSVIGLVCHVGLDAAPCADAK